MMRAFKIRLLPTEDQEQILWKTTGVSRFAWNWGLAFQMERFKNGEKLLGEYDLRKEFNKLKTQEEYSWLKEVSSKAPVFALFDLMTAYKNFFRIQKQGEKFTLSAKRKAQRQGRKLTPYDMKGHPQFKKRERCKPSFAQPNESMYFQNGNVVLLKVGHVKFQTNYELPEGRFAGKFYNPRVSFVNGKWILSFAMEVENQNYELKDYSVGIDLGIKVLAVASVGGNAMEIKSINKSLPVKRLKKRLKHSQRNASRKSKKSNNQKKAYERVAKLYRRLTNIRQDYTHKATRKIVDTLPKRIVVEDLNISGMMKNKHLARAVAEQNFYEFRRQLEYKCEARGIELVIANRFFPSSKKCSRCGEVNRDLKLKDRTFICPACSFTIDRDLNAARNLENYIT